MRIDHDAIVIGAGFSGLRMLHALRDELGLDVVGVERAAGVGGTWWWNRYPGARCDIESVHYSYSFDDELQRDWEWSERYAAQPEILAYLEHVADRFDLRRSFRFETTVTSVVLDEDDGAWCVRTDDGTQLRCRFVVCAQGGLSDPVAPDIAGLEDFAGDVYYTSSWPHEGVDFRGKRVAIVGTGSTGIQVIPVVAEHAAHLTVLQRTPNYVAPLGNAPVPPEQRRWLAENHAQVRAGSETRFLGVPYPTAEGSALDATPEQRRATYDRYWGEGFRLLMSTYSDLLVDPEANETIAEYIRGRIRGTVRDPKVADLLCPDDHPYGTKRAPFGTGYYETFNRDNVSLVSLRETPIERISAGAVHTTGAEIPVDALIFATGFDAFTGPLFKLGIVGRDGRRLEKEWADGPSSYLGIGAHGFPNLFTMTGPQSHIAFYNNPAGIEQHIAFMTAAIRRVVEGGHETIEVTEEAQRRWRAITESMLAMTLLPRAKSWYMGANVPGKPRAAFLFPGGGVVYGAIMREVLERDLAGLSIDGAASPLPPMLRLDPAALSLLGISSIDGIKPLELCTPDEVRAGLDGFRRLQQPGAEVRTIETGYPSPGGGQLPARIFLPDDTPAGTPVILYFHGGGWMGGSIDLVDERCRAIVKDHAAIVVAASYRLAPEHPFPAAPNDAYAALQWTAETIASHGGDPSRIIVGGDSAGGNLAAVIAQRARDEDGPAIAGQILIYPATGRIPDSPSMRDYEHGPILSAAAIRMFLDAYLGETADETDPLVSPMHAASLEDLPPALVLTAECDPLRDEGEAYAEALQAAGVATELVRVDGLIHGGFSMSAICAGAQVMHETIGRFIVSTRDRGAAVPVA